MCRSRSNYKHLLRKKRYEYRVQNAAKLLKARVSNARDYWKLLKSVNNYKSTNSVSANQFARYFKSINDPDSVFYQADEDILFFNERYVNGEIHVMFGELDVEISNTEILKAIKQLKNNKSCGPDLLLNEFFKYGADALLPYLYNLFNKCLMRGYFPESWSEGHIVPIFKSGDQSEASNYRGITLLSTLGKLFTRILNNRLTNWAEEYNVYVEAQA